MNSVLYFGRILSVLLALFGSPHSIGTPLRVNQWFCHNSRNSDGRLHQFWGRPRPLGVGLSDVRPSRFGFGQIADAGNEKEAAHFRQRG